MSQFVLFNKFNGNGIIRGSCQQKNATIWSQHACVDLNECYRMLQRLVNYIISSQ